MDPCFPEPTVEDPTNGHKGEHRAAFLRRSTSERARELRDFYNRNLAALPEAAASALCLGLKGDRTLAKHFELVVGRFLQLIGADPIEYEPPTLDGRNRIDWAATFADGYASVEATLPIANAVVDDTMAARSASVEMVVRHAPPGWHVMVHSVPTFHPGQSLQPLRQVLREAYRDAPTISPGAQWSFERYLSEGHLDVSLLALSNPDPSAPAQWGSGPAVGFMDDTSSVLQSAIRAKRRQVKHAARPVLIALCTAGSGGHQVDNFDIAVLGRTVWNADTGSTRFDPSGELRPQSRGKEEPTFAGVLAFPDLGMRGGSDPILYQHPRFTGLLPSAFSQLRRRYVEGDSIAETPVANTNILDALGWPTS
jgi:hypothetical protein